MALRLFLYLSTLLTICNLYDLHAQTSMSKTHRILILLDGSASMAKAAPNNKSYFENASQFITHLIDSSYTLNEDLEYGLRVYGHQYQLNENKCNDSRLEVRFTKDNLAQISLRLRDLKPKGNGNANYAIQQTYKNEMVDTQRYWYSIVWLTADTGRCFTDPCFYINQTIKSDLYKLFHIQLNTNNRSSCFEQMLVTSREDEMVAIAGIVPFYKKDKKPEAYWDIANRKKPKTTYTPSAQPAISRLPAKNQDTLITLTPKGIYNKKTIKNKITDSVNKRDIPIFIPPLAANDSVAILKTLKTHTVKAEYRITRVKAGTIAVPAFNIPLPEQKRDSVVLLKPLSTRLFSLNNLPEVIAVKQVKVPAFVPHPIVQPSDSVDILVNLNTKNKLTARSAPTFTAIKVNVSPFTPPLQKEEIAINTLPTKTSTFLLNPINFTAKTTYISTYLPTLIQESRDSVASIAPMPVKNKTRQTDISVIKPKPVTVTKFHPPNTPDILAQLATRSKPLALKPAMPQQMREVKVPEFYALSLPPEMNDTQTEMPPEAPIEEVVDANAVPAIVFGNLIVKAFGATVRVQVYRIKLGEDILVSDNSFSGPKQIKVKLEPGRYKLRYNLNDGTEVTKPFLIDEEMDTNINVK